MNISSSQGFCSYKVEASRRYSSISPHLSPAQTVRVLTLERGGRSEAETTGQMTAKLGGAGWVQTPGAEVSELGNKDSRIKDIILID